LRYRQWQDEVVLFNDISGATHLLSLEALQVLERLGAGPASEPELGAFLSERFEVDPATLSDDVADLLEQLSSLDLIEPCPE
jgi:PqqD family protein of HPr-rel-A system